MRDAPAGAARARLSLPPLTHYRLTMNFSARTVFVTLAAAVFGIAVAIGAARVTKPDTVAVPKYDPPQPGAEEKGDRKAVGMAGCLAAACHGAPADKSLNGDRGNDCWQSSGSCWAAADPHTAAYSLLTDSPRRAVKVTAAQIMAKYRPGVRATDDARCLACHTNPALADKEPQPDIVALREQGVSCEACHGNAGQWLQPHTSWKGDRTEVYKATGLKLLYDLGERALACAGCHVGAPAGDGLPVRDMNHDMIAAGHPRLDFDFAEYQRRLPRHWQEKDRTKGSATPRETNEAQVWYVGRVAHAEAACRLLASRAERSEANDHRSPWPEFAEFNCAACHHNLHAATDEDEHWRKDDKNLNGRPIGSTPWQTIWPVTHAAGLGNPARANSEVAALVRLMEGETGQKNADGSVRVNRHAKSGEAKALALTTAEKLASLRRELATAPAASVAAKAEAFFPKGAPLVPEWDSAGQLFFGLASLEYAKGQPNAATVKKFGAGAAAFRARQFPPSKADWANVKAAFEAIR